MICRTKTYVSETMRFAFYHQFGVARSVPEVWGHFDANDAER
jgi:hypothetical protein